MSDYKNDVVITGKVCNDKHKTTNNFKVCDFGLKIGRKQKNGTWESGFINCVAFGEENDLKIVNGSVITIKGHIDFDFWTDKETGKKRFKEVIKVNTVDLVGFNNKEEENTVEAEMLSNEMPF